MPARPRRIRELLDHQYGGFDALRDAAAAVPDAGRRRALQTLLLLVDELDRVADADHCDACDTWAAAGMLLQLELAVARDVFGLMGRALGVLLEAVDPATRERAVAEIDPSASAELLTVFARAPAMSLGELRDIVWPCARGPYLDAWLAERQAMATEVEAATREGREEPPDDDETLH